MSGNPTRDPPVSPPPPPDVDACDIPIDHDLEGIDSRVLKQVVVGDHLAVDLNQDGYKSVVCRTASGDILGALSAFSGIGKLINCLEKARRYAVTITELRPGYCHVRGGLERS